MTEAHPEADIDPERFFFPTFFSLSPPPPPSNQFTLSLPPRLCVYLDLFHRLTAILKHFGTLHQAQLDQWNSLTNNHNNLHNHNHSDDDVRLNPHMAEFLQGFFFFFFLFFSFPFSPFSSTSSFFFFLLLLLLLSLTPLFSLTTKKKPDDGLLEGLPFDRYHMMVEGGGIGGGGGGKMVEKEKVEKYADGALVPGPHEVSFLFFSFSLFVSLSFHSFFSLFVTFPSSLDMSFFLELTNEHPPPKIIIHNNRSLICQWRRWNALFAMGILLFQKTKKE